MSTKCTTPLYVKNGITSNEKIPVPCGKCPACIKRRTSGWSFRLIKHSEVSKNPLFVTLTYDPEHVPKTKNGYKTLQKSDVQKFFKRLRKLQDEKIKYYAVGEYGTQTMRPHYHLIIFNTDELKINRSWALDGYNIGTTFIGNVTGASIGYTLKYLSKEGKIPQHKNDDRQPEFQLMSKGLGKNYLTENMKKWHHDDLENRMYIPMKEGKKIAMPRYYKDKIYSKSEKNRISRHIAQTTEHFEDLEMLQQGEYYHHNQAQKVLAQFRKMHKQSKENYKK